MSLTFWQRLERRVYSLVMYLLVPVILWRLAWRGLSQRNYFRRWNERFGFFTARDGEGGALWVHAVSVGEVAAATPLITRLRERYPRSEEHTSELQSLMRISYAVFCLKKKTH